MDSFNFVTFLVGLELIFMNVNGCLNSKRQGTCASQIEALTRTVTDQQRKIQNLTEDLLVLNKELKDQQMMQHNFNGKILHLNVEMTDQQQTQQNLNWEILDLNEGLNGQQQMQQNLTTEILDLNEELKNQQQMQQNLTGEIQDLNEELKDQQQMQKNLTREILGLYEELKDQQQTHQNLTRETLGLNEELKDHKQMQQNLTGEILDLNAELKGQRQMQQNLTWKIMDLNGELQDLTKELQDVHGKLEKGVEVQQQIEQNLTEKLQDLNEELKKRDDVQQQIKHNLTEEIQDLKEEVVKGDKFQQQMNLNMTQNFNYLNEELYKLNEERQSSIDMCEAAKLPENCEHIRLSNPGAASGTYTIYLHGGKLELDVYCDFCDERSYIYLSRSAIESISTDELSQLYTRADHALIRLLFNTNHQQSMEVSQLSFFQNQYKLSFQISEFEGHSVPLNYFIKPFLYVGFQPTAAAPFTELTKTVMNPFFGYRTKGEDILFTNVDQRPNSFLAFFTDNSAFTSSPYYSDWSKEMPTLVPWYLYAQPVSATRYLPLDYFMDYELRMGGAGGFGTSYDGNRLFGISGATIGFAYDHTQGC